MRWLRRSCGNERGMTVVETVFAASILLIFVTASTAGMLFSVRTVSRSTKQARAVELASAQIEKIRTLPFDSVGTQTPQGSFGNPAGSVVTPQTIDGFTIATTISWVYDGLRVTSKLVKVTVSWENPTGSVREQTRVYGKSALVNVGTLRVFVRDWDTAAPLSGAAARATNVLSGDVLEDSTDSTGQVIFGGIAPGSYDSSASASGYLLPAPGSVQRAAVPADGFADTTVRLQRPSSITFTVTDDASAPISGADVTLTGPYSYAVTAQTDGQGRIVFDDLYVGQYSYEVTKAGYTRGEGTAQILTGNEHVEVGVQLIVGGDLVVVVKDENGVPISQPLITIAGPSPDTNQVPGSPFTAGTNGQLSVSGLTAGTYTVTAEKSGYVAATNTIDVSSGGTATLNVTLQRNPYGQLQIRVVRSSGTPRVNYRIRVTGPNGFDRNNLRTDANGYVLLTDLVAGTYRIYAPYNSGTYTTSVVSSGQLTQVTLIR